MIILKVDTEERYVAKLHLLDQEFRVRVEADSNQCGLGRDKQARLFSNIGSIYQFHNAHFLPPLLERRRDWQVAFIPSLTYRHVSKWDWARPSRRFRT